MPEHTAHLTPAPDSGGLTAAGPSDGEAQPDGLLRPPARTTFLIAGIAEYNLTDTLIVGCFYRDTAELRLMSVPRDLYTRIPESRLARMRADGLRPPGVLKINAMRSYGRAQGTFYLLEQLGEMLGVNFDYYVEVELDNFINIVDALGGVWIDVPDAMRYDDEVQGLYIDIPAGRQHFDGRRAEGLVRYRGYPSGDVGRNAVQMAFVKQLMRQALTKEAVMRDPLALVSFVLNDVRHNLGTDVVKYLPYVSDLKSENINTYTMPGEGRYVGKASYFIADEEKLPEAMREVFYAVPEPPKEETAPRPSHGLRIQVLNGSRVAGLGSDFADILTRDGYTVTDTGVYTGPHENTTRIRVRDESAGADLPPYFKNAVIRQDRDMPPDYDVIVIVGRGE